MNPQLIESLYTLVNSREWQAYIQYKQERLDQTHRELEWLAGDGVAKAQGKVAEIRADLELQSKLQALAGSN